MTPNDITEAAERKWPIPASGIDIDMLDRVRYIQTRTEERELQREVQKWAAKGRRFWYYEAGNAWVDSNGAEHTDDELLQLFLDDKKKEK